MESVEESLKDRRSFLGQLGKTLGVGLGLGLVASKAAHATSSACAIFCSPVSGSCSSACCGTPPCPTKLFHCTTLCGYDFYQCLDHACSGFCLSQNAC